MAHQGAVDVRSLPTLTDFYTSGELTVPESVANPVLKALKDTIQPSAAINNKVVFYRGDITKLKADAIVNAANRMLMGGGGVDGAIHRAAGWELLDACIPLGGCATGEAKITAGFALPARYVIHTVGPVYDELDPQESNQLLANCYTNSLQLAVETDSESPIRTVAFCAISTGIYGFPSHAAAAQAVAAVRSFLSSEQGSQIDRVVFVTFEMKDVDAYKKALPIAFPPAPPAEDGDDAGTEDAANETSGSTADEAAPANPEIPAAEGVAAAGDEAHAAPSSPVAGADDAPVAGADDAPAADAGPEVVEHTEEVQAPGEDTTTK